MSGDQQDKCVACSYIENDDGTISGNRNCQRDPPLSLEVDCPIYQSNGCYSASSIHEIVSWHLNDLEWPKMNSSFILHFHFSWMVTTNSSKNTKQQRVAHISEHLVTTSNKLTKSLVMYHIKHLNRHVLEPTVIDICKPFLKINRKHYWFFEIFVPTDGIGILFKI